MDCCAGREEPQAALSRDRVIEAGDCDVDCARWGVCCVAQGLAGLVDIFEDFFALGCLGIVLVHAKPPLPGRLVDDAEPLAHHRAHAQEFVESFEVVSARLSTTAARRLPVDAPVWSSQVYVVLVSGDDRPEREAQVAFFAHYERCPSGQVLDSKRPVAFETFDARFNGIDAFLVGFDACHKCSSFLFSEVRARTVTRVGVVQVVRIFEGDEVQFLACYSQLAPKTLPLSRTGDACGKTHPFIAVDHDYCPGCEAVQTVRAGDIQVVKAVDALECELAVLRVVE